jgi:DNA-binding IclR family transcriptional regulator
VPIELTALGRAWVAAAACEDRDAFMAQLRLKRRARWRVLKREIDEAVQSVERRGYCVASWQPQVLALAAPIAPEHYALHVLNVSVTTDEPRSAVIRALEGPLLTLAAEIRNTLNASVL